MRHSARFKQIRRIRRVGPPRGHVDRDTGDRRWPPRARRCPGDRGPWQSHRRMCSGCRTGRPSCGPVRRSSGLVAFTGRGPSNVKSSPARRWAARRNVTLSGSSRDHEIDCSSPQSLEHAADKAVVTRPAVTVSATFVDAAVIPREHAQVGRGGVEGDGQLRLVVARGPEMRTSDCIQVFDQQPCLDIPRAGLGA